LIVTQYPQPGPQEVTAKPSARAAPFERARPWDNAAPFRSLRLSLLGFSPTSLRQRRSISRRNTERPYRRPDESVRSAHRRALAYLTPTNRSQQCIASVISFFVDPPIRNSKSSNTKVPPSGTSLSSARSRLKLKI